jgi:hypothetical protein
MSKRLFAGLIAASAVVLSPAAFAGNDSLEAYMTPAQGMDNGLGGLPAYDSRMTPEMWVYMQPAERQDSGLGAMPAAEGLREPWFYMQPAAKIDSGLGEQLAPARVADSGTRGI